MSLPPRARRARGHAARLALVCLAALAHADPATAQSGVDGIRSEMKADVDRLTAIDYGLARVVMQDPRTAARVSPVRGFVMNVQVDLDYLSAMLQLVGLAREPSAAASVVLEQLEGAQDRMLLDEFEQEVMSREQQGVVSPLQSIEKELLDQLHRVRELYARTGEALGRSGR